MQEEGQKNQCNFAISMGFYLITLATCIIGLSYWYSMEVIGWLKALFLAYYILHLAFSFLSGMALFGTKANYDQNIYCVNVMYKVILCFWGLIILLFISAIIFLMMQKGNEKIVYVTYVLICVFVVLAIIGCYCGIMIPLNKLYINKIHMFAYKGIQYATPQHIAIYKYQKINSSTSLSFIGVLEDETAF